MKSSCRQLNSVALMGLTDPYEKGKTNRTVDMTTYKRVLPLIGLIAWSLLMMWTVTRWDKFQWQKEKRLQRVQEERKRLVKQMCLEEDVEKKIQLHHLFVDDTHGLIYCYVPKVACTNWKAFMEVLRKGEPYANISAVRKGIHYNTDIQRLQHYPKNEIKARLKHYTKFLFVRDPFVRFISAYRDKLEKPRQYYYDLFGRDIVRQYGSYSNPPENVTEAYQLGARPLFKDSVKYLVELEAQNRDLDEHWRQIYRLCSPCLIDYDFIGHQETMTEDAEHLMRILKLQNDIKFPPSYDNVTTSEFVEKWFKEVSPEDRRKLYQMYEKDFKLFGYIRPDDLIAGLI